MVPATGSTRLDIRIAYSVVSGLAKKGRFYERNQYFLRSAYRPLHDPAAPLDAQAETTGRRVSITEDVPVLRIDHVPIKGELLGVWQALYSGGVLDFKEINRRLAQASENFSFKDIRYEKHQMCRESEPTRHSRPPNAKTPLALHPASDKNPAGKLELGFTVADVEAFYRDMSAKGVLFSMPPKKQDFGGALSQTRH